jgi:hypothetical protein
MNWHHIARHAAIAIGLTFVVVASVAIVTKLLMMVF